MSYGRKNPAAFRAMLSLTNGYAPVMRQVLKIYHGQMERNKAISKSGSLTIFGYAPSMRRTVFAK